MELIVLDCRAGINLREQHIQRDLHVSNHVSVRHLDVLHLRRESLPLECLHPHQLDLYRLYHVLRLLNNDLPIESLIESTVDTENLALKGKLRDRLRGIRLQPVWGDRESLRDIRFPILSVDSSPLET